MTSEETNYIDLSQEYKTIWLQYYVISEKISTRTVRWDNVIEESRLAWHRYYHNGRNKL